MACTCTQSKSECNPCPTCDPAVAACECLPSALDNFTSEFFGTIEKSVVDGKVVWSLPCDLSVGLENNPRLDNEGLACYFLRLFGEGITGLTGPEGAKGDKGDAGADGYFTIEQAFVQPAADCPSTTLYLVSASGLSAEATIWIPTSGYYRVLAVAGNSVFIQVKSATGAVGTVVPAGTEVYLTGPQGVQGAQGTQGVQGVEGPQGIAGAIGAAGPSAATTCLTSFTQPAPGSNTVPLTFQTTSLIEAGQTAYVMGGGYYEVVSVLGSTVTLKNLYDEPANETAGNPVNAGGNALVIVAGARGQGAYTYTTANFTQPAIGATVSVNVASTTPVITGSYIKVAGGGTYRVVSIASGVQFTLQNSGSDDAAAPGATVSSGAKVVPAAQPPELGAAAHKFPVVAATTANIALTGEQTIDGVACVSGNRVLVKDQATASENGIYVCAVGAWSRSDDADTVGLLFDGVIVTVQEGGTVNEHTMWIQDEIIATLGVDDVNFFQIAEEKAHADAYISSGAVAISIAAPGTWYQVTGLTNDDAEGFTFAGDAYTCTQAGQYMIAWNMSILPAGNPAVDLMEGGIAIGGTALAGGRDAASGANSNGYRGISGVIRTDLAVGNVVTLVIRNTTDTDDVTIRNANLVLLRVR